MYEILNLFLFIFHAALTLFIAIGWIWRRTRRANLILLVLTAFSWFVLGIWYGFGYCPCTDWHWRVRYHLGRMDMPRSYIKFLFDKITGLDAPPFWVDVTTLAIFALACVMSLALNWRDYRRAHASAERV